MRHINDAIFVYFVSGDNRDSNTLTSQKDWLTSTEIIKNCIIKAIKEKTQSALVDTGRNMSSRITTMINGNTRSVS